MRAVHDMVRAMTGVMTLLSSAWVIDPELSSVVLAANRSYTECMHQVEDVVMTAFRTTKYMVQSAGPIPLQSYGSSLAYRHARGRKHLKSAVRDTVMHVKDLRRMIPSMPPLRNSSNNNPIASFVVDSVENEYKDPSPLNLIARLPSALARSQFNSDTGIVLPSFNESFNKIHNSAVGVPPYVNASVERVSEYNVSSSMSDMSSVCDVYAPSTSPISPVEPSSLMLPSKVSPVIPSAPPSSPVHAVDPAVISDVHTAVHDALLGVKPASSGVG